MNERAGDRPAWQRLLTGTALTAAFAVGVAWGARAYGRSIVFAFSVNWVLMVWAMASGWWDAAGWLSFFNVLHNGYPVLSMRQLRARLDAVPVRPPSTRVQPAASVGAGLDDPPTD
jgi:hypothetical protein